MKYLDILEKNKNIKGIFEEILSVPLEEENKNIYLTECASNVSKMLACYLFQEKRQTIIYVTSSIYEASRAYDIICDMIGTDNVSFFPTEEFISSELIATSEAFRLARMLTIQSILNHIPQIIVTNVEGMTRQLMSSEKLKESILHFEKGMVTSRDQLIHDLVIRGYKKTTITSLSGTFSVRGSLIDVFPINCQMPIRISFFDNEIENIKQINLETQMSIGSIDDVTIYPLYEMFYDEKEIESIKNKIIKHTEYTDKIKLDIESIENYQNIDQLYIYLPYICEKYQPFYELVQANVCIFEDFQACLEHEKAMNLEISDYLSKQKNVAKKEFFVSLYQGLCFSQMNIFTHIFTTSLLDIKLYKHYSLETSNAFEYSNNMKTMLADILSSPYKTFLVTHLDDKKVSFLEETFHSNHIQYQKIKDIHEITIPLVYITVMQDAYGFENLKEKFVVITPNEFMPSKIVKNSKYQKFLKDSVKIYNKEELNPGDYVVHQDYGIGRYIGIKTKELRNTLNDYLCIEYANDSKLYIPVENIYVLEKYIGSKDKIPKLNNLNSKEWQKKKERIKEKTKEIAKRLIKVQAEREAKIGFSYREDSIEQQEFENDFEFDETPDQLKAIEEVKQDMEGRHPLDRLICGDVGFGKTEVAMRAAFKAVDNGKQVAYLAPTTVLTRQHYYTFKERFEKYGIRVELMNRFISQSSQENIIRGLKSGYVDIVIGTHRILSNDIVFKDLGLLIIDEEQRFGVEHKEKIKEMKSMVDVLTLTATPIPRTLQMALSGLRDLSLIETAPNNRLPIQTYVLESNDSVIREAIHREMGRKGQVFYLLNRISELEHIRSKIHKLVPKAKIGLIHGKMDKDEIENELIAFLEHGYDVLICTTIIETGIDIPNANTLIIERADILGLSQLYQIRGRVGRSDRISYAYLMYDKGKIITENAQKRLEAIKEFTELGSGYKIAMRDLAIRGSGDILGSEQSGYIDAVGMDLYMKLLNEAIQEEKGLPIEEESIRKYQISISRHVDETYVSDDAIRIDIHKSINKITSRKQMQMLIEEYTDRYGKLNEDMILYMEEKYLEYLLKKSGVESFKETEEEIKITFDEAISRMMNIPKIFEISVKLRLRYQFDYRLKRIIIKINPKNTTKSYIYDLNRFLEILNEQILSKIEIDKH